MSLPWCDPYKYSGGPVLPSSQIPFTGKDLTILASPSDLTCNANINEVIEKLDFYIKSLVNESNLTALEPGCLIFDRLTIKPNSLHQLEIDEICGAKARLTTLEDKINNLDIGNETLTINLGPLAPLVTACEVGTNTYKLFVLINLLITKVNTLQTQIDNL